MWFGLSDMDDEEILRFWIQNLTKLHTISPSTLSELCYRGIPSSIRPRVWPFLIGNSLQITPELYSIFKSRANFILQRRNSSPTPPSPTSSSLSPPPPSASPSTSPSTPPPPLIPSISSSHRQVSSFGREESLGIIQYDIPRTHALDEKFHNGGPINVALESILQTYACYRPDIGYVQGMSYIAAVCVDYLDEFQAFSTFAHLINRQISLFLLEPNAVKSFALIFDHILQRFLPQLYHHLLTESVSSEIFILEWALTLFSKALPIPLAARLWDVYFVGGELFFVKACLGILEMYEFKLETNNTSGILKLLSKLPSDFNIDKLMGFISNISLTQSEYEDIKSRYFITSSQFPSVSLSLTTSPSSHSTRIKERVPVSPSPSSSAAAATANEEGDDLYCFLRGFTMCLPSHHLLFTPIHEPINSTHKE